MVISRNMQQPVNAIKTPVISIFDPTAGTTAFRLILSGNVIALPTDTIYGIAVSAQNNNGIKSLYEIKKRDKTKPISICVADTSDVKLWGKTSHLPKDLIQSLLPGAVTLVLKRKTLLNPLLNPHTDLVGIRVPECSFIQNLARACGVPLALTSANLSSEPSPLKVSEFHHLWPHLGGIFDGGTLGDTPICRAGSTIINLSEPGYYSIIRSGSALESTLKIVKSFGLNEK